MKFYRCKCGSRTCWSSMGPSPCAVCSDCKSDLAEGPGAHRDPKPHALFPGKLNGADVEVCYYCLHTTDEIRKHDGAPQFVPYSNATECM
jgi:hypothetical protein